MAQALLVVLIDRVPSPAARASQPTWSTPGRPCSQLVSAWFVRRETPRRSRARAVGSTAVAVLTGRVYGGVHPVDTVAGGSTRRPPTAVPVTSRRTVRGSA